MIAKADAHKNWKRMKENTKTKLKWSKANVKAVYAEHGIISERNHFLSC